MLEVRDLHAYYGKSHILHGVHLAIGDGEIVSLLGRNGVGRSTALRSIMGLVRCSGSVRASALLRRGLRISATWAEPVSVTVVLSTPCCSTSA